MRRGLKWIGILLAVLFVLVVIAGAVLYVVGRNKLNETYDDVQAEAIPIPADDPEAVAWGQHLSEAITLCSDCHSSNLGGDELLDVAVLGTLNAPNLTSGQGGLVDYTVEDWVLAVRHGIDPEDNTSLLGMPSHHLYYLSDADLGAIVAYIQSLPPVDNDLPDPRLAITGYIVMGLGMLGDLPADAVDHDTRPTAPEAGVTVEYGEYLANIASCHDCHGDDLTGGPSMGPPPGPDLTQAGDLGEWSEQDFINTMRQGITPDGDTLDPDEMPWNFFTRMTDDELKAIWLYLQTLEG